MKKRWIFLLGKMMNAANQHKSYGGPETLEVSEVARPTPKPDEFLVKVSHAALNPIDYKMMAGWFTILERGGPEKMRIRGYDVCGRVVVVGAKTIKRLSVGDDIIAMMYVQTVAAGFGTWAEYVCVKECYCCKKPEGLSDAEGAGLPLVGLTSYHALTTYAGIKKGDKALVLGGSGGTGTVGIQVAKALGASLVATTCSSKNAELVKSLGAETVIDYATVNWWEVLAGHDYDIVYDCVGGPESWPNSHKVLKSSGGRFVTITGDKQSALGV